MTTSESYILNTIQTPYSLRPVYESIEDGHTSVEEVGIDTCLPDGSIREAIEGLQLLRLIRRSEHEYQAVPLDWETGDKWRDFQLTALGNLAAETRDDNWGKQAAVLLNYQYLITEDRQRFDNNETPLYERIDEWTKQTTAYRPKGDGKIYEHNDNKFGNWTRLVHYLGLVYKVSGREHTVYPHPELILASIKRAAKTSSYGGGDIDLSVREYLGWLDENLIRIGYVPGASVPATLSRILYTLVQDERIELREHGDAGVISFDRLPTRSHPRIDKEANAIRVS